jgi:WD40 repeat protein
MPQDSQFDVFLSHSSKDKAVVRPLAERLRNDGLRVWFDEWEIRRSDDRSTKIEEGLDNSRVLVLCMSANAFGSDWAQLESQTFRFRDPLNKNRRFIPLRLDHAPVENSLAQFLCINWYPNTREREYAKLLEACRSEVQPQTEDQEQLQTRLLSLGHGGGILSVAWSPDGQQALSGSYDQTVRLWELASGRCLRVFEGHSDSISSVSWGPDGQQALSGSYDQTVRLWDIASGRCLRVFEGHSDSVSSVARSPDGQQAISGSNDQTMRLWEIASGRCLRVFEGHSDSILSVAWSPNEQQALSGSYDQTMRLWDIASGRCLRVFEGHSGGVASVAWSPDGKQALAGSYDRTIRLWETSTGGCLPVF